jgi:VWFA-related protein
MGRVLRAFAVFLLAAARQPVPGQDAEVSQRESAITFSTGVNLVPVKVVVRDKDGRAVGNLEQADFELRDNGRIQTIARFSVEQNEALEPRLRAAPVDEFGVARPDLIPASVRGLGVIPEHFLAYVFDDVHTPAADLMRAREAAVRTIDEVIDPARRVAVYTISGQTALDFTDDLDAIEETLNKIRRWSADEGGNDCPVDFFYYWADLIVNRNDRQAFDAAVEEVMMCMHLDDRDAAEKITRSKAIAMVAQGQRESRLGLGTLEDVVRRISAMPGSRTIVYVSAGFFVDRTIRYVQQDLFDRAIRAGVVINALDARGLYTVTPGGGIDRMGRNSALQTIFQQRLQSEMAMMNTNVMGELASATGGTFVWNDNDYAAGYRRLAAAPEYTYVLSFAPRDLKNDGSFHEIKVTLKDKKGLEVFARSGYFAPDGSRDAEQAVREEIRDAVFSRAELADLPVEVSLQYYKPGGAEAKLTVLARLDVSALAFRKGNERNNDIVTVVSAVFDRNGNFIKGVQRVIDMKLRDQTLARLLEQGGISVRSTLDLEPGSYLVRVVVRDAGGAAMAARNGAVEIPY